MNNKNINKNIQGNFNDNSENIKNYFQLLAEKFLVVTLHLKIYHSKDLRASFPDDDFDETALYRVNARLSPQAKSILPSGQEVYEQPRIDFNLVIAEEIPANYSWKEAVADSFTWIYFYAKKTIENWQNDNSKEVDIEDIEVQEDDDYYAKCNFFKEWIDKQSKFELSPEVEEDMKKYFELLGKNFLTHDLNFEIEFKDNLMNLVADDYPKNLTPLQGTSFNCFQRRLFSSAGERTFLEPELKFYVTMSREFPARYSWRGSVINSFTWIYFYSKISYKKWQDDNTKRVNIEDIEIQADDQFYAQADIFDEWLDKELNLPPRHGKCLDRR